MNLNCNGFHARNEKLKLLIATYQPLITSLRETRLKSHQNPLIYNYNILKAHAVVLIVIKSGIQWQQITPTTELQ